MVLDTAAHMAQRCSPIRNRSPTPSTYPIPKKDDFLLTTLAEGEMGRERYIGATDYTVLREKKVEQGIHGFIGIDQVRDRLAWYTQASTAKTPSFSGTREKRAFPSPSVETLKTFTGVPFSRR